MQAIATIGPVEHPTRLEVSIQRPSTMPDFYICTAPGADAPLTIHRHKLRPIQPPAPESTNAS
jgi:hypothetical protein